MYTEINSKRKEENMKKIALFSVCCCFCLLNAYAAANLCKTSITFSPKNNNWNAGSNEYLFETKRDYLDAINSGYFYECDSNDTDNCGNNSYVQVAADHVFKDKTIKKSAIYKCVTGVMNDKWEEVSSTSGLTKCTKKRERYSQFQNFSADEYLYPTVGDYDAIKSRVYSQVYECDSSVCADGTIVTLPAGHVFKRKDINKQRRYKCVLATGDDQWVDITDDCDDCDNQPQPAPVKKQCTFSDGTKLDLGAQVVVDCSAAPNKDPFIQDARTGKKCYKSCHEKAGKLVGFYSVKECENNSFNLVNYTKAEKSVYSPEIPGYRRCVKKSSGSVKPQPGSQPQKPTEPAVPVVEEPAKECTYYFSGTIECGNGKNVTIKEERAVTVPCIEGVVETLTEEMFKNDTGKLQRIKDELCNGETAEGVATSGEITSGGTIAVNQQQEYKIRDAEKILDAFTERAESERSVWKTSEGKFNTTRLASDITAGVVLGTVGGVVTGVVIKKNQVKKGFEALHCTVGGQKVAEWGDEFSVGLQR